MDRLKNWTWRYVLSFFLSPSIFILINLFSLSNCATILFSLSLQLNYYYYYYYRYIFSDLPVTEEDRRANRSTELDRWWSNCCSSCDASHK